MKPELSGPTVAVDEPDRFDTHAVDAASRSGTSPPQDSRTGVHSALASDTATVGEAASGGLADRPAANGSSQPPARAAESSASGATWLRSAPGPRAAQANGGAEGLSRRVRASDEYRRARHQARLHPELAGNIDELWLNVHDLRRNQEWWTAHPRTQHDAATNATLAELGRCTTLQCASRKAARLQGRTRFNFPHYFLVGWQKCATTSVNAYLQKHPQTLFGRVKETHYFTSCQGNQLLCRADNETHYLRDSLRIQAATAGGLDRATFDASADYARWGIKLAPQLFEVFPWLKIVVMLREPISRTISYTRMHTEQQHGAKGCLPGEALYTCLIRFHGPGVRRRHVYNRHLEAWLAAFPRGQVHVIQMEAMQEDPETTLDKLKAFLGMDVAAPRWDIRNVNSRHKRRGRPMQRMEYEELAEYARRDAVRVAEVLDRYGAGDGAAFMARWEKVWQGVLAECEGEQCFVDSN